MTKNAKPMSAEAMIQEAAMLVLADRDLVRSKLDRWEEGLTALTAQGVQIVGLLQDLMAAVKGLEGDIAALEKDQQEHSLTTDQAYEVKDTLEGLGDRVRALIKSEPPAAPAPNAAPPAPRPEAPQGMTPAQPVRSRR